ncbi:MAG TPA: ferric reductase-like transmembrane domain-containing protein [Chromobacteriaceae bacterium]|nr:ferric reductase-like transmembrane domain-containing protein [Chromobacteriaceae bacterium]
MKYPLLILAALFGAGWYLSVPHDTLLAVHDLWTFRRQAIPLSGLLLIGFMAAGGVLATRLSLIERWLGGLDRVYRLHKRLGIAAGVLVLLHWQLEWLPKQLAKLHLIVGPLRHGAKAPPPAWRELAGLAGEWAGYIMMALVVIALLKRVPYRAFRLVHKAFGVICLMGAYHSAIFIPAEWWRAPAGVLGGLSIALMVLVGVWSLSGRIGQQRRIDAVVETLENEADDTLLLHCKPLGHWPGHKAGQFALLTTDRKEGAHPFTIASHWQDGGELCFGIKGLGDYTRELATRLQPGMAVTIEGPYGGFDFGTADKPQIWVAGGIGITPFLARLEELAARGGGTAAVECFYCSNDQQSAAFGSRLEALARQAGVTLHRWDSQREGRLEASRLQPLMSADTEVWFCGPAAFGHHLRQGLQAQGLAAEAFHAEAFNWR